MDTLSLREKRNSTKLEKTSLSTDVFQGSIIDRDIFFLYKGVGVCGRDGCA